MLRWSFVLVASACFDMLFTWLALGLGASEGNPVMAGIISRWGFPRACLLKAAIVLWVSVFLPAATSRSRLAGPGLIFCTVVQAAVAVWGFRVVAALAAAR